MFKRFLYTLPLLLLSGPATSPAAEPMSPQLVVTPRATAVAVSATNRPFLAATRVLQPVNLAAAGYTEVEYIVRGIASRYEWTGEARSAAVAPLERGIAYATRILVRRPVDAAKASGIVVVELLDAATLGDTAPLWGLSWQHFTRRGDVWVGVTVKPVAVDTLRRFDAVRYGALSFGFSQAANCTAAPAAGGAATDPRLSAASTENGLAWDVIAQVGALLRSSSKENPLPAMAPRHLIAAGYGQGSGYVITFANAMHDVQRLGNGAPIFDGYLGAAGAEAMPINQCAPPLADADPRRGVLPRDVPFVLVMTESDFSRAPALRRDDSDESGDVFRLYEIPGAGQAGTFGAGVPINGDLTIAGIAPLPAGLCAEPASDYPVALAFNAIWQQYAEWLNARVPLARVPRIEASAGQPVRDANGNAQGGWRLPQLDLPIASYAGRGTPREAGARAVAACAVTGVKQPFNATTLKTLYRDRTAYLEGFRTSVEQAVAERRVTPEDGEALKNPLARTLPAF